MTMMSKNDKSLLRQLIQAGKFNLEIYELLVKYNESRSKELIKKMGDKWCCHPDNRVKRLDVPLPILSDKNASKILRRKT